jgi:hypothetical protein
MRLRFPAGWERLAMKRIEHCEQFGKSLPAVCLYLDDIEAILEEFRNRGFRPEISDDDFEYSTLQELIDKKGKNPKLIRIWANGYDGPAFNLYRWSINGVRVRGGKGDQEKLVLSFMERLLAQRRRWWTYLPDYRLWMALVIVAAAVLSVGALSSLLSLRWIGPLLLTFGACSYLTWFSLRTEMGLGSVLYLDHAHATTSLWSRHAEKLLYTILGAVAGVGAKTLADFFLR